MKAPKQHLSIKDYAKKCGISTQQVYNRIRDKKLQIDFKASAFYLGRVIDVTLFPIVKKKKAGRKLLSSKI